MWWAWRNRVELYLARGFAAISSARHGVQVVSMPATVPLSRLLEGLAPHLPAKSCLYVVLSASIARPFSTAVPKGLKNTEETEQFNRAKLAQTWGEPAENLRLCWDARHPGIVGALSQDVFKQLQNWAQSHSCKIVSLEPAWALASQLKPMRQVQVKGFVLQEPDGLTFVSEPDGIDGLPKDLACFRFTQETVSNWKSAPAFQACTASQLDACMAVNFQPSPLHKEIDSAFKGARWDRAWRQL